MPKRIYDDDGNLSCEDEGEDFNGFEVSNEHSIFYNKIVEEDTPTICSPIPENQITAIVFNSSSDLLIGDEVELFFSNKKVDDYGNIVEPCCGGIKQNGKMAGEFKPQLVEKILSQWTGKFVKAVVTADDPTTMVTLYFSNDEKPGCVKI